MQQVRQERSLGELFSELGNELSALVTQEMALLRSEMAENVRRAGKNAGFLIAGVALGYAGLLALIAAIIIGLYEAGLPGWVSALLVGVAVVGTAYLLIQRGLNDLKQQDLVPRKTIDSLKEDQQWAKQQLG